MRIRVIDGNRFAGEHDLTGIGDPAQEQAGPAAPVLDGEQVGMVNLHDDRRLGRGLADSDG